MARKAVYKAVNESLDKIKEIEELIGDRIVDRFKEDGEVLVCDWGLYRSKDAKIKE